jgi:hypothetical protein
MRLKMRLLPIRAFISYSQTEGQRNKWAIQMGNVELRPYCHAYCGSRVSSLGTCLVKSCPGQGGVMLPRGNSRVVVDFDFLCSHPPLPVSSYAT